MKKQLITIAALTTLLALTGCDSGSSTTGTGNMGNTGKPAETTAAETSVETEAATDAASTTIAVTEAVSGAASEQSEGSVKLGEGIFGGSVVADTAVKSKPDAGSDTLITIPAYTQIGVYESGKDGWFMTEFQGKTGYIPADSVKEIQPFDPSLGGDNVAGGSVSGNAKLMSGTHKYAETLETIPDGTQVMYYVSANDPDWCVVNYNDKVGYVEAKYIKAIEDYVSAENPYDEYIGKWKSTEQWNGSDFYIEISRDREEMNVEVTSHSAVADYKWNYRCICSEDGTFIQCNEGGTQIRTDYSPEGEAQDPVTVYTDGTARFNIKGGTLFWSDEKEDTAGQVGFKKSE